MIFFAAVNLTVTRFDPQMIHGDDVSTFIFSITRVGLRNDQARSW
jgi:hypothetical protein